MIVDFTDTLSDEVRAFLEAVSQVKPYRMIARGEMPIAAEVRLCEAIQRSIPISEQEVIKVRSRIDLEQAYFLVNFARRMAVYAARINEVGILKRCTLGFVFDENLVEWRDILMDLSIVEDCAVRLGTDIQEAFAENLRFASDKRRETITGYCSRPPEMRGLKVMRVAVSGSGHELTYTRIPWA